LPSYTNESSYFFLIEGVIPFDDTHGVVNNSPFVNGILSSALSAIGNIYAMEGAVVDNWKHYAEHIVDTYDSKLLIHPAYDTYTTGGLLLSFC